MVKRDKQTNIGNEMNKKTNKVTNENIGNFLLEGGKKYYENSIKEVITDNGYIIGLTKDGEVMVSQIVVMGTMSNHLEEIVYDELTSVSDINNQIVNGDDLLEIFEKDGINKEQEEIMFNKVVDNFSTNTDNEFKDCVDWESIGYGNEEVFQDNTQGLMKEVI